MWEAIIAIVFEPGLAIGFIAGLFVGWAISMFIWGAPNVLLISIFSVLGAVTGVILFGKSVWPKK